MTSSSPETPPADASEADWAEQQQPAGAADDADLDEPVRIAGADLAEANEADVVEQEIPAYMDDDDEA
jgi:hypothetical protein